MEHRDFTDVIGGGLLVGVGVYVGMHASGYGIGTLGRMGPGFFPMVLGYVLTGLGTLILFTGMRKRGRMERMHVRPFFAVLSAVFAFALAVPHVGMVPATFLLVGVAAMAEGKARLVPTLLLAAVLSFFAVTVFCWGLGLSIPAFKGPF